MTLSHNKKRGNARPLRRSYGLLCGCKGKKETGVSLPGLILLLVAAYHRPADPVCAGCVSLAGLLIIRHQGDAIPGLDVEWALVSRLSMVSRMARLIKPLTLSPWACAWAWTASYCVRCISSGTRFRFLRVFPLHAILHRLEDIAL